MKSSIKYYILSVTFTILSYSIFPIYFITHNQLSALLLFFTIPAIICSIIASGYKHAEKHYSELQQKKEQQKTNFTYISDDLDTGD